MIHGNDQIPEKHNSAGVIHLVLVPFQGLVVWVPSLQPGQMGAEVGPSWEVEGVAVLEG